MDIDTRGTDDEHPLGWGLLGASNISSDWAKSLADVPGAKLVGVAARSAEKAAEFARTHGVARAHASYDDLVNDKEVDVVYVGTITRLHKDHALKAIAAGKHVLCEKPLAETEADGRAMYAAARAKGVMLQEGMWTRFFPAVERARELLALGTIGEVRAVQADFPDRSARVELAVSGSHGRPAC
jgi:predicted dehydrogenase